MKDIRIWDSQPAPTAGQEPELTRRSFLRTGAAAVGGIEPSAGTQVRRDATFR